ncbi:hypothetical protein FRC09_018316 [Ceratobasidium sp. 395]|nr:hypothetical protein FRC09_018316 [Ceratobasidium sp. 395]
MAAVLAPAPAPLHRRRRTLHEGALLLANQAASLVNVPAAGNAAHDIRTFVTSLKPRILQAPRENDQNAREQVIEIQQCAQLLATFSEAISRLEDVDSNSPTVDLLTLLGQFNEYECFSASSCHTQADSSPRYLSDVDVELKNLLQQSLTVKFARQTEITRLLDAKKEETLNRIVMFCFENGLLANYASAQTQADLSRLIEMVHQRLEHEMLSRDEVNRLIEDQGTEVSGGYMT